MPIVLSHKKATVHALARLGIRRSSARTRGTGIPVALRRSVGSTSGRASAGGIIVTAIARSITVSLHVTQARKTRSLTARSVIASTLLGTEPPRLPGRALVQVAELFGITEGTTRTALSRMVAAGELTSDDGSYQLSGTRLLERQVRQSASRRATRHRWHGGWAMAIVVRDRRDASARADLRSALESARLAELREGVWARPDNIDIMWPSVVGEQCTIVQARDVDPSLVTRLWPLDAWADHANELRAEMDLLVGPLENGETAALADGFVVSAAVLRQFQADPLLPEEMLPRGWPGAELREEYDRFDLAYRALLRDYFRILP
jgi:phenylacetic acid degradation operon negative regulatory protein